MREAILLVVSCAAVFGQSFDVASVKPAAVPDGARRGMTSVSGGPGTKDPGQFTYANATLMSLILRAYGVNFYRVSGPSWLDSEDYDIVAKIPEGTTKDQFKVMLQNLLAERFHLMLHHELRDLASYEMVVGKRGAKLKETTFVEGTAAASASGPGPFKTDAAGFPVLERATIAMRMTSGPKGPMAHLTARAQTVATLASMLTGQVRAPVIDKTGLTAKYDFTIEFSPEGPGSAAAGAPGPGSLPEEAGTPLQVAIQEQLGLRLDAKKVPTDVLVVDKADKVPTAN